MEMINKLGKKAAQTYQSAAKATERFAKEIKLKTLMSEDKEKIQEIYEDIGKQVYEKYLLKSQVDIHSDFASQCNMIDVLAEEIEDIRMSLLKFKSLKQCSKCHYEIFLDYLYCPHCGEIQMDNSQKQNASHPETSTQQDIHLNHVKTETVNETVLETETEIEEEIEGN